MTSDSPLSPHSAPRASSPASVCHSVKVLRYDALVCLLLCVVAWLWAKRSSEVSIKASPEALSGG